MEGEACLLGLDLGTTTCRCLAFDLCGALLVEASREVPVRHPGPSLAEVDPEAWWRAARSVLREVADFLATQGRRPLALGVTGLMHAIVALDAEGQVLAPAMLWMDQRCQPQVRWLNENAREKLAQVLGSGARVTCTPSLPKLRWLSENAPEVLERARWLLLPKDYVRYRLTGVAASDASDAGGTMLYDRSRGCWSAELASLAGIRLEQLPPLEPSTKVVGEVSSQGAEQTGLPVGLPVVAGAGDVAATILGAGEYRFAPGVIYLGTAAWVHLEYEGQRRMRATATTGAALRWVRDLLGSNYVCLAAEAEAVPPGAEGLVFLPHLCGERAPYYRPEVRGALHGLTLRHGRGHLARSVMEGCACHLRWLLDNLIGRLPRLTVVGGGARSDLWPQILASVLKLEVIRPRIVEAGALGAAMLAGIGIGVYADRATAIQRAVHVAARYMPDVAAGETYDALYERFLQAERWVAEAYLSGKGAGSIAS